MFYPAHARAARGLPRLRALFDRWMRASRSRSIRAASTSAARSSSTTAPARCATRWSTMVQTWQAGARPRDRAAPIDEGHLRADTDAEQMLFEIHGLILALHHDARFLRNPGAWTRARAGFERLLAQPRRTGAALAPRRARRAQAAR